MERSSEDPYVLITELRSILLAEERERLDRLLDDIAALHQTERTYYERLSTLQAQVNQLCQQIDSPRLAARLGAVLSDMISQQIRERRDEMAEALGPVMGEAIRVQIRDSRQEMIEALYPIIGSTVQRALAEFSRELQRNIDARLKMTFGPQGWLRSWWARWRGVAPAELVLREALPFRLHQIFLIQRHSGLLMAHRQADAAQVADTDLISGMLTAIRDFVRDAFAPGADEELDEIQYGEQRIIVQNGRAAYLAVVISGIEPPGFRARLHDFVAELHTRYENAFRDYNGDPAVLPPLDSKLARLIQDLQHHQADAQPKPLSRGMRLALASTFLLSLVTLGLICFYVRFTLALLPVAFPAPTPTFTVTWTPTLVPTSTPIPTLTASPTSTPLPSPTPTLAYIPAVTLGNVWVRTAPSVNASPITVLYSGSPVKVLYAYADWMRVEWISENGVQQGWVSAHWVSLREPLPPEWITPTPQR